MSWTDSSGMALADYPHPSLAVDVALLTVADDALAVLLHRVQGGPAAGRWALPGSFVRVDERLRDAALRVLAEKVQIVGERPRLLGAFDDLDRDSRGRVISLAYVDLVPVERLSGQVLAPIDGDRPVLPDGETRLAYDHDLIVARAVEWVRDRYRDRPDPARLLGHDPFTSEQLRRLHLAVLGVDDADLQRDTFRRRMEEHLVDTGRRSSGTVGRPARLYVHKKERRRPNLVEASTLRPGWR